MSNARRRSGVKLPVVTQAVAEAAIIGLVLRFPRLRVVVLRLQMREKARDGKGRL